MPIQSLISLRSALILFVLMALFCILALGLTLGSFAQPTQAQQAAMVVTAPTRVVRAAAGPTKFARLIPTDTPFPTLTPTLLPTATQPPTSTATRVIVRRATIVPTAVQTPTNAPTATPHVLNAGTVSQAGPCAAIPGTSYYAFALNSPPTDRPAALHPDLNLALRGYAPVVQGASLVDYDGDTAGNAPQLDGLFGDRSLRPFKGDYAVYDWDWGSNTRGDLIEDPAVTLIGLEVTPGEVIHLPGAGTNIGLGYQALVLYAGPNRVTLKYTGDDNVRRGYTLHLENVCVEPGLLALYQQLNDAGRGRLPALHGGDAIGRATGTELGIAIRDNGTFMDPRSRKDWWRGH